MARKRKHPEHINHERWLISYADFITLLFAFFVVMFASSQSDKGRAQQVSDAVKKALLAANAIGYSSGPSGVYLEGLFQRMGIADQIKAKLKRTAPGVPVGSLLASGEADIGMQQVSELLLFPGIQYVGPLPAEIQHITVFSGGIHTGAKEPDAAKALVKFITSPEALPAIKKSGLEQG